MRFAFRPISMYSTVFFLYVCHVSNNYVDYWSPHSTTCLHVDLDRKCLCLSVNRYYGLLPYVEVLALGISVSWRTCREREGHI